MSAAVGPRTRAALQALGYGIVIFSDDDIDFCDGHYGKAPDGKVLHKSYKSWWGGDREMRKFSGCHDEDGAWALCLDHLKANAEALCSRMMTAIGSWRGANILETFQHDDQPDQFAAVAHSYEPGKGRTLLASESGDTTHDAVLALFLKVCCDEGETPWSN